MVIRKVSVILGIGALVVALGWSSSGRSEPVVEASPDHIVGKTFRLERAYLVSVHVPSEDVDKVLTSLAAAVGLEYGKYDHVAYIDAEGSEHYRPLTGSKSGAQQSPQSTPSKVVTVSIVHDAAVLKKAVDAIYRAHSYEEPVILITEGWRSRSTNPDETNKNRWWNQQTE